MTNPRLLGPLSSLHEMMGQLLTAIPAADASHQYHPDLGSLCWYFGRSVYREVYWLREVIAGDADLSHRVQHLFVPGALPLAEQCAALPPVDHLLNWAGEIQDEHLTRLANPRMLPEHPSLQGERMGWFLLQEQARDYEHMLVVLNQRQLRMATGDYRVERLLQGAMPRADAGELDQGHYRIGARDDPAAYDNELPPQAVPLSACRIGRRPVNNAEFLAFMQAGGYQTEDCWSQDGWRWQTRLQHRHPAYWRQDSAGHWYAIGINGPADLPAEEPVAGISRHEAEAFSKWTASLGETTQGAVLQHEYQWEVAARTGVLSHYGRVQEWCANPFHGYPDFQAFPDARTSEVFFNPAEGSLRAASLHGQKPLRRLSCRDHAAPEQRSGYTGLRLVFPAGKPFWE